MYYANAVDRLMQEGNGIEMVFVIRCSPVPNGPLSYMLGMLRTIIIKFNNSSLPGTVLNTSICLITTPVLVTATKHHYQLVYTLT